MKKRIISLILLLSIMLSSLMGCGGGANGPQNPDPGTPPDVIDPDKDNGKPEVSPEDGDGDKTVTLPENVEDLLTSYDRLENADLSFNFDISTSVEKPIYQNGKRVPLVPESLNRVLGKKGAMTSDGDNIIYNITASQLSERPYTSDFFNMYRYNVESLGEYARGIADYCIENIIEVDKAFKADYGYYYVLHYDRENEEVSVKVFSDYASESEGNGDGRGERSSAVQDEYYCEIRIYYDADGDEVVQMQRIHGNSGDSTECIVYCPNKIYEYRQRYGFKGDGIYNEIVNKCYKEDGMWRGIQFVVDFNKGIFNQPGEPYGSAGVWIQTLYETEDGIYTYSSSLDPQRANGDDIWSNGEGMIFEDDVFKLRQDGVWLGGSYFYPGRMDITLEDFVGYDSFECTLPADIFTNGNVINFGDFNSFTNDASIKIGDAVLRPQSVFVIGHGFLVQDGFDNLGNPEFIRLSDGEKISRLDFDWDDYLSIGIEASLTDEYEDKISRVRINFALAGWSSDDDLNLIQANLSKNVRYFMNYIGLTHKSVSLDTYFGNALTLYQSAGQNTAKVFETVTGYSLSADGFKAFANAERERDIKFYTVDRSELISAFEKKEIDYDALREYKELDLSLITIGNNIGGNVNISEQDVDFSAVNVLMPKSILLSNGKSYGVVVTWALNNQNGTCEAFDIKNYLNADMSFTGKSGIALPEGLYEGSYTLYAYFARINENGAARLSEVAYLPVNEFESFEREYEIADEKGNETAYIATYSYIDGKVVMSVELKDVTAPLIEIFNTVYDAENNKYVYTAKDTDGKTGYSIYSDIEVYDDRDGRISITPDNVKKADGADIDFSLLASGDIFTVSASDKRGNETVVTVEVVIEITEPEEGNGEVISPETGEGGTNGENPEEDS